MPITEIADAPFSGSVTEATRTTSLGGISSFARGTPRSAGIVGTTRFFMLDLTVGNDVRMDEGTRSGDFTSVGWGSAIFLDAGEDRPILAHITPDGLNHVVYPVDTASTTWPGVLRSAVDAGGAPTGADVTFIDESTWGGDEADVLVPLPAGWTPPSE